MTKQNISAFARGLRNLMARRSPEILTGIGIAGMVTAAILAVRATPKALTLLDEKKREINEDTLTPIETVKTAWTCYIPAVVTGLLSASCLVGASSVNARRNAALATAYSLSESALREYQEKVVEAVGEKKERSIRDAVAKERVKRDPVGGHEIIATGKGTTLCYDAVSGRYFYSDIERLKKAQNELNRRMMSNMPMCVSLNELYYEIGLAPIQIGEDIGWNCDKGLIEMDFSSQLTEDGTPCLVLSYQVAPEYDYQ